MDNFMSNLIVKGKVNVCGIEVPNIYGGFLLCNSATVFANITF
jgi:hypothetical protein